MWPGTPRSCERSQTNTNTGNSRYRNHDNGGIFGDTLVRKSGDNIRILLHNPGGLVFFSVKRCILSLKIVNLKYLTLLHDFDLVGLTEVNKDWRSVQYEHTIWGATSGWYENRRIQVANNTTKPPSSKNYQIGGVATMVFNDLVCRLSAQEGDFRKLGRWCSVTITGKINLKTSIFNCYCPVRGRAL